MAAEGGGGGGGEGVSTPRTLQVTPTWAVATVIFIFIFVGIFIEYLIHLLGHWLKKHRKNGVSEAVEKLKSVLMQMGFMSLTLAITRRGIAKICIPNSVADYMLPCPKSIPEQKTTNALGFSYDHPPIWAPNTFQHLERKLESHSPSPILDHCGSKGMTPLISAPGTVQLSTFIFVLAVMQIVYSIATMALGRAKSFHVASGCNPHTSRRAWLASIPLGILSPTHLLFVGTKLEVIVAKMALQLQNQNNVIKGAPLVQPSDNLFWFGRPEFVLTLLHYTLFVNAFEFAFFVWVTLEFGFYSCYHERVKIISVRAVLAVMVQILCSYITLPLYALVTQMGTHFKSVVLEEQTVHVIRQWHEGVRDKRKKRSSPFSQSPLRDRDDSPSVWSNNRTNSPDLSSHHRIPSLAEFSSRQPHSEIIEIPDQEISPHEPSSSTLSK
ncbi:hypothetical protein TEA_025044 [Camellia sinensis var. sinensis]|uniref:MLO-like protein n=1 Tax=Camellia sinensis var. sinensis TaxID=542762 RepID=A0A4S4EZH3_CAMSN|nr:hypothetical protein TEA_025044 [Camellia sinensis var. sinensis]